MLKDNLVLVYERATVEKQVQTFREAAALLRKLSRLQKIGHSDFTKRIYMVGEETIRAFFYDLQGIAAQLKIPPGMVKAQFENGLPQQLVK